MSKTLQGQNWPLTPAADGRRYSKYPAGNTPTTLASWNLPATISVPAGSSVGVRQYALNADGWTIAVTALATGLTYDSGAETIVAADVAASTGTATFTLSKIGETDVVDTATVALTVSANLIPWPTMGGVSYVPIVRNLRGPGAETVAGSGRNPAGGAGAGTEILYVNSLSGSSVWNNTTKRGSLRGAVGYHNGKNSPSTIVFETSGTIDLNYSALTVSKPYLTIAGQTAPAQGIQIIGAPFLIRGASHQCWQHFTVRMARRGTSITDYSSWWDSVEVGASTTDAAAETSSAVFDHLTAQWGTDETFSSTGYVDKIILSNCIVAEGVQAAPVVHMYNSLFGDRVNGVSFYGCLFMNGFGRSPLTRAIHTLLVNNVIYNWGYRATDWQSTDRGVYLGLPSFMDAVGNYYKRGPENYSTSQSPIQRVTSTDRQFAAGSKLWVDDNAYFNGNTDITPSDKWAISGGATWTGWQNAAPHNWPTGLIAASRAAAYTTVQSFVGSRPGQRDSDTQRLITELTTNTGTFKSLTGATGQMGVGQLIPVTPTYAVNTNTFPAAPAGGGSWNDVTSTGYTKLEDYLHELEDAVL